MSLTEASEPEVLAGMVDKQRDQMVAILDGLGEAEARTRLVPSLTTPLGLVKHATFVEQVWFHHRIARVSREAVGVPETVDESFALHPQDTVASVRATYVAACARSREICAGCALDDVFGWRGTPVSLRYIYAHMIAELARHAGHGDILVEQLRAR